jgi:thiamine biosynthesis protein ThiC
MGLVEAARQPLPRDQRAAALPIGTVPIYQALEKVGGVQPERVFISSAKLAVGQRAAGAGS